MKDNNLRLGRNLRSNFFKLSLPLMSTQVGEPFGNQGLPVNCAPVQLQRVSFQRLCVLSPTKWKAKYNQKLLHKTETVIAYSLQFLNNDAYL